MRKFITSTSELFAQIPIWISFHSLLRDMVVIGYRIWGLSETVQVLATSQRLRSGHFLSSFSRGLQRGIERVSFLNKAHTPLLRAPHYWPHRGMTSYQSSNCKMSDASHVSSKAISVWERFLNYTLSVMLTFSFAEWHRSLGSGRRRCGWREGQQWHLPLWGVWPGGQGWWWGYLLWEWMWAVVSQVSGLLHLRIC